MKKIEAYKKLKQNPKNIRFSEVCSIAELFGFINKNTEGSHRVYTQEGIFEILNFQNMKGKAKPYQVKQFIKIIEKYDLAKE
ncbi:MAG: type II toxin-antitoxin system HicA family toxin [Candidatus Eremiobacterota bacterium]